ncbi:TonB family protein [Massilia dura]|uniref:TonB family protein n=1 Tax=Pseudoduganella dura TaxID=321982 RepID=A0A6I3XH36_9BURK|nr:energy transducer TonB [Pseudoduganella dura]MUI13870.1 TonB family protein [Pseudoduganella dura]GGY18893.1 cell envelope biogenesis protein TonB [Pseudoduganella dura]
MQTLPGLSRPGVSRLGLNFLRLPRLTSKTPVAPAAAAPDFTLGSSRNKSGKIAVIVGIHLVAFWAMQNGMVSDAVKKLPQVVDVTFVTPPAPPAPPAPPKIVEVAIKPPPMIMPVPQLPIVIENTITVPPAPVKPAEAVPAVVAAPSPPAPPVAAPPAPSAPKLVTGVEYVRQPQPVYPSISRRLGETGVVTLRVLVSEKGTPEQATVQKTSGSTNLDEAGRQAALRSLFKPYMEDGKPVPVYVLVPINFKLS